MSVEPGSPRGARPATAHPVKAMSRARRDAIAGGVIVTALILLTTVGWRSIAALEHLLGRSSHAATLATSDRLLMTALLLNLALILFGWRRYRDLAATTSERDAAQARASLLARHDDLTGLLNRRALVEDGAATIAQMLRRDKAVALLVVDLDHFKSVNEIHGHLAGDVVLRAATDLIRQALPASAIAGRLDGDEFALLLPFDPRHTGTIDAIADYIVGALGQPIVTRSVTAHVGASIGIARSEPDCKTVEALLRRANIAARAAKAAGRSRHIWFDATMERQLVSRNATEAGIRDGIPLGQFVPYYEPQVDLATGAVVGFEMLARWEHPTRGTILPEGFIPLAEECGLIAELSASVMRRAFAEARDWDAAITLSVNISPRQLKDPWLAQKIVKLLVETRFPASRLEIEITESALFENLSLAQSIVGSLKNQGIRLALDDFGTGYSSLAHLRALPFDRIKIDKSFVVAMTKDRESAAIVDAISKLGESLNLPVTAEGVEDAAIHDQLRAMGCAKGQGWHFGKPMPIAATRRLLAERGLLPSARGPLPVDLEPPAILRA
jgi:diguanylate cyclase (GGDEF)-like protein